LEEEVADEQCAFHLGIKRNATDDMGSASKIQRRQSDLNSITGEPLADVEGSGQLSMTTSTVPLPERSEPVPIDGHRERHQSYCGSTIAPSLTSSTSSFRRFITLARQTLTSASVELEPPSTVIAPSLQHDWSIFDDQISALSERFSMISISSDGGSTSRYTTTSQINNDLWCINHINRHETASISSEIRINAQSAEEELIPLLEDTRTDFPQRTIPSKSKQSRLESSIVWP
jgi:hypothetical protein